MKILDSIEVNLSINKISCIKISSDMCSEGFTVDMYPLMTGFSVQLYPEDWFHCIEVSPVISSVYLSVSEIQVLLYRGVPCMKVLLYEGVSREGRFQCTCVNCR